MDREKCYCGSTSFHIWIDEDKERIVPVCEECGDEWADLYYKK